MQPKNSNNDVEGAKTLFNLSSGNFCNSVMKLPSCPVACCLGAVEAASEVTIE